MMEHSVTIVSGVAAALGQWRAVCSCGRWSRAAFERAALVAVAERHERDALFCPPTWGRPVGDSATVTATNDHQAWLASHASV